MHFSARCELNKQQKFLMPVARRKKTRDKFNQFIQLSFHFFFRLLFWNGLSQKYMFFLNKKKSNIYSNDIVGQDTKSCEYIIIIAEPRYVDVCCSCRGCCRHWKLIASESSTKCTNRVRSAPSTRRTHNSQSPLFPITLSQTNQRCFEIYLFIFRWARAFHWWNALFFAPHFSIELTKWKCWKCNMSDENHSERSLNGNLKSWFWREFIFHSTKFA